jgi:hypothetical protein
MKVAYTRCPLEEKLDKLAVQASQTYLLSCKVDDAFPLRTSLRDLSYNEDRDFCSAFETLPGSEASAIPRIHK